MIDPKTGIHEQTVTIPIGMDTRDLSIRPPIGYESFEIGKITCTNSDKYVVKINKGSK